VGTVAGWIAGIHFPAKTEIYLREILGSHTDDYKEDCLFECCAV
jgi:hypothetical protein